MTARALRLVLRVDATATTGLGHAVRMSGIVAAMPQPLELIVVGDGESLTTLFPGATVHGASALPFRTLAAHHKADGLVADLPAYESRAWDGAGPPVIAIDDYGGDVNADLVINGTVLEEFHHYPAMKSADRILKGPHYCLVRPAFGRTFWRGPNRTEGVVVVAGSGVRAGAWAEMVTGDGIDRSGWGKLTVIVGPTFARLDRLKDQCARIGADLKVGVAADTLAEALTNHRLALITGGVIVYEAMAVGVPAVVIPQVENLIAEAKWFAAHGCIHDLGFDAGMNPEVVASAVTRLLRDDQLANDMSTNSRRVIDGQGIVRAAAAITDLLQASARAS